MPLSYLPVLLGHSSNMRTEVASNRGHVSLYCRHAVEVDSSSTSQACSGGKYLRFFLLPGGVVSSYCRQYQQVLQQHMRTMLKVIQIARLILSN